MFPSRYFGKRFWAGRYFPPVAAPPGPADGYFAARYYAKRYFAGRYFPIPAVLPPTPTQDVGGGGAVMLGGGAGAQFGRLAFDLEREGKEKEKCKRRRDDNSLLLDWDFDDDCRPIR